MSHYNDLAIRKGHHVCAARDGEQALIRMKEKEYDVVLMDIQMPILDGLQAAQQRRVFEKIEQLQRTPIIALTASVLESDRSSAEHAGMDGFANKPIDMLELSNEIARVTGAKQRQATDKKTDPQKVHIINVNKGVEIWGSLEGYAYQVELYLNKLSTELPKLFDDAQANHSEKVFGALHAIKGVAGNLGLDKLYYEIEKIEKQEVNGVKPSVNIWMTDLHNEVEMIENEMSKLPTGRQSAQDNHANSVSIDKVNMATCLNSLEKMIDENHFDEKLLQTFQQMTRIWEKEKADTVINLLDDFEFEEAKPLVTQLLAKLN